LLHLICAELKLNLATWLECGIPLQARLNLDGCQIAIFELFLNSFTMSTKIHDLYQCALSDATCLTFCR
jgi:hypothetical protein